MTVGVTDFCGTRLKEAREARGLTATALANISGIQPSSISRYEKSESLPLPETLEKLSNKLDIPISYFLRSCEVKTPKHLTFRSYTSATVLQRAQAAIRFAWVDRIAAILGRYVIFQKLNFPDWDLGDPLRITDNQIEELAIELRRFWGLGDGPIGNVAWLLENNGFIVTRDMMHTDSLDAFSEWGTQVERPIVILGMDKASAARSRFDGAHEVGHRCLHKSIDWDRFVADRSYHKHIENQAHRFGAALLFPKISFIGEVRSAINCNLNYFRVLKERWKVSISMMINRAWHLRIIEDKRRVNLYQNLNHKGWRQREPLDDVIAPEIPHLLQGSVKIIIENKVMNKEALVDEMRLERRDIESICQLPDGYLTDSEYPANIIELRRNEDI